jgi:hypothetical protein
MVLLRPSGQDLLVVLASGHLCIAENREVKMVGDDETRSGPSEGTPLQSIASSCHYWQLSAMRFSELLETVGDLPLFQGSLLLAGDRDPGDVRRQLSRWTAAGKILQLRRNLYALAPPWRRVQPHPFLVANELHHPSYVSLQSALAYHGMIPEAVPVTTSVTTARPIQIDTPFGRYTYRHVRPEAFFGYDHVSLPRRQEALLASPAKALLDLVYFTPAGGNLQHLRTLRLEAIEDLEEEDLHRHAGRWRKKKIRRAVESILRMKEEAVAERQAQR